MARRLRACGEVSGRGAVRGGGGAAGSRAAGERGERPGGAGFRGGGDLNCRNRG